MWYQYQINEEKNSQVVWDLNPNPTVTSRAIYHYNSDQEALMLE